MAFWILFLGSTVAGFLDLKLYWKDAPVHSTILLTIIGVGIVITARSSSIIYSLIETSFYTQAVGSSIIDDVSYKLATTAIFRSYVLLASTTVSTLYRDLRASGSFASFSYSSIQSHHATCPIGKKIPVNNLSMQCMHRRKDLVLKKLFIWQFLVFKHNIHEIPVAIRTLMR